MYQWPDSMSLLFLCVNGNHHQQKMRGGRRWINTSCSWISHLLGLSYIFKRWLNQWINHFINNLLLHLHNKPWTDSWTTLETQSLDSWSVLITIRMMKENQNNSCTSFGLTFGKEKPRDSFTSRLLTSLLLLLYTIKFNHVDHKTYHGYDFIDCDWFDGDDGPNCGVFGCPSSTNVVLVVRKEAAAAAEKENENEERRLNSQFSLLALFWVPLSLFLFPFSWLVQYESLFPSSSLSLFIDYIYTIHKSIYTYMKRVYILWKRLLQEWEGRKRNTQWRESSSFQLPSDK